MRNMARQNGFSLTEVLIATAILAIGLIMIAMAFPVGVKLTSIATERTVGTVAANEAFAKFQLYARDPDGAGALTAMDCNVISSLNQVNLPEIQTLMPTSFLAALSVRDEQWYPSVVPVQDRKYHWSIIARQTDVNELQLTAFVTRLMDSGAKYYDMDALDAVVGSKATSAPLGWPVPVIVGVSTTADANEIKVTLPAAVSYNQPLANVLGFFTEGCTIVDDTTGEIYRVVEIKDNDAAAGSETLVLGRPYSGGGLIWVVPPAVGSTRNPCIAVQQRVIRF